MLLSLVRDTFTLKSTTGKLSIDRNPFCVTLELPWKDGRPGSCILPGRYNVITYASPRFGRLMPLLIGVPLRDPGARIEIHWLNFPDESEGCIGVGKTRTEDAIWESRNQFDAFWKVGQGPMERGECWIEVIGGARVPNNSQAVQDAVTGEN